MVYSTSTIRLGVQLLTSYRKLQLQTGGKFCKKQKNKSKTEVSNAGKRRPFTITVNRNLIEELSSCASLSTLHSSISTLFTEEGGGELTSSLGLRTTSNHFYQRTLLYNLVFNLLQQILNEMKQCFSSSLC